MGFPVYPAADWLVTRTETAGEPDAETMNGRSYDLVEISYLQHRQDEQMKTYQWRLSFLKPKTFLLSSCSPLQRIMHRAFYLVLVRGSGLSEA
jgi:hypothetical protein